MKPDAPDHAQRRAPLYFILMAAVVLAALLFVFWFWRQSPGGDEFARLMNTGKGYYEQGQAVKAIEAFQKAVALQPTHPDALLNLANACLLADRSDDAIKFAQQVLGMDSSSAAADYIAGCADLRLRKFEEATTILSRGLRLGRHVASDPTLIALLVGLACRAISAAGLEDVLELSGPNAEVAGAVQRLLLAQPARFNLHDALRGEVAGSSLATSGAFPFEPL